MNENQLEKKYQVFVSSTFMDLKEERQKIVETILLTNNIPAGMELFTASDKKQWEIIEGWIDESDIFILLLGSRYGTIPEDNSKSYTHLEFDYALKQNKKILVFSMDMSYMYKKAGNNKGKEIIQHNSLEKLEKFKCEATKNRLCILDIEDAGKLQYEVSNSLNNETKNLKGGWVKYKDFEGSNTDLSSPIGNSKEKDFKLYEKSFEEITLLYQDVIDINLQQPDVEFVAITNFTNFLRKYSYTLNPTFKFVDTDLNNYFNGFYQNISKLLDNIQKFEYSAKNIEDIIFLQGDIRKDFSDFENRARHLFY